MTNHLDITPGSAILFRMRTTLTIDDDMYAVAASLAKARSISIGAVLSDLARKGLETSNKPAMRSGFPVFDVGPGARPLTPADIERAEDER